MIPPKAKAAVLLASPDDIEAQFYEALQRGDIERLMAVWSDDDEIVCVHPGGPRVVGPGAIRTTFEPKAQEQAVQRAHEKIVNDALFLFVAHDVNPRALSPRAGV